MLSIIKRIFGYCPGCGRWFRTGVKRRRQSTAYVDEESNYVTCCPECFDEVEEHWGDMWGDFYSGLL